MLEKVFGLDMQWGIPESANHPCWSRACHQKIKNGKACGPEDIPAEAQKLLGRPRSTVQQDHRLPQRVLPVLWSRSEKTKAMSANSMPVSRRSSPSEQAPGRARIAHQHQEDWLQGVWASMGRLDLYEDVLYLSIYCHNNLVVLNFLGELINNNNNMH